MQPLWSPEPVGGGNVEGGLDDPFDAQPRFSSPIAR